MDTKKTTGATEKPVAPKNPALYKTEVVEENKPINSSMKERLMEELAESKYSTSKLTYSQFIAQAVEKVLG